MRTLVQLPFKESTVRPTSGYKTVRLAVDHSELSVRESTTRVPNSNGIVQSFEFPRGIFSVKWVEIVYLCSMLSELWHYNRCPTVIFAYTYGCHFVWWRHPGKSVRGWAEVTWCQDREWMCGKMRYYNFTHFIQHVHGWRLINVWKCENSCGKNPTVNEGSVIIASHGKLKCGLSQLYYSCDPHNTYPWHNSSLRLCLAKPLGCWTKPESLL